MGSPFSQNKTLNHLLNSLNLPCRLRRHQNMLLSLPRLQTVPRNSSAFGSEEQTPTKSTPKPPIICCRYS
ncbi:hypothetical protein ES288_A05G382800v1 [Gossypium darwinii]|uniref:Uncharacterized protein n=1 Tax=Gossypium darwinii TaxID=34276 RepID=A0A5D2GR41_GOSDA|nr:hypothetical protein ES288_A05G382800v1 [Gossypium darwinii]